MESLRLNDFISGCITDIFIIDYLSCPGPFSPSQQLRDVFTEPETVDRLKVGVTALINMD